MIFVTQKKSVYVDSVAGSDANDGLTPEAPKATCAAGMAVLASSGRKTIRLKCGSFFREQITLPAGKRLKNYGSGARPILDPRENIAAGSWTLAGGYTKVYQQTVTHALSVPSTHRVWQDGVRLLRVPDLANCESTPGSFYAPAVSGTTVLLSIHPTADENPTSNGRAYSYSKRMYGVNMGDGCTVDGITAGWQGGNDGSIRALARSCVIQNCDALDGTKHNLLLADGTLKNVNVSDWEPIAGVGSQTGVIIYNDFAPASPPISATLDSVTVSSTGYLDNQSSIGIYAHGNKAYAKFIFRNCRVEDCATAYSGDADTFILDKCTSVGCYVHANSIGDVSNGVMYRNRAINKGIIGSQFATGVWKTLEICHCEAALRNILIAVRRGNIRFCTFARSSTVTGNNNITISTIGNLSSYNSIYLFSGGTIFETQNSLNYAGDRNLFFPVGNPTGASPFAITPNRSFAQWKTAMSADANSLVADPQITAYGTEASPAVFNASGPVYTSGFPLGVQPTDDAETLALLASVGYTP